MMENGQRKTGKRLLRIFLLLMSSVLVVAASASILNYLYMQASPITPETAQVQFVLTEDSEAAGASIGTNGTYVSLNSMAGWPNATRVYQAAVGIRNFDSASRNITLAFASWSGDTDQIEFITVIVRDAVGGTQQGEPINVGTPGSSTGELIIPAGATWVVEWDVKWKAGALSTNSVSVTLQLLVKGE
ncbi:MAG: hypothetical protein QXK98_06010 [Candidatus Bathyarchaeia archaeon]